VDPEGVSYVAVTAKGPALTANRSLAHRVRTHKLKQVQIKLRIVDVASAATTISLAAKV
jgi:hypothetical protein